MANPQKENGHIQIANEIWDALCRIRISGEARQVLDVILRQTYGYNKKKTGIELAKFVEMTGIIKTHITRNLKKLEQMGLISITQKGNKYWNEYEFIKDFDKWLPLPKKVTLPIKVTTVTNKGNSLITYKDNNKDKSRKKEKFNATATMIEKGANEEDINAWVIFRAQRNKPVTARVLSLIASEAEKANISFSEAIKICADEQWLSFKANWNFQTAQQQSAGGLVY